MADDEAWPQRPAIEPTAGLLGWPAAPAAPAPASPPGPLPPPPPPAPAAAPLLGPVDAPTPPPPPPPATPPSADRGPDPQRRVLALGAGAAVLAFLLTVVVLLAVTRRGGDEAAPPRTTALDTIPPGLTVPTTATTLPATRDPGVVACQRLNGVEAATALGAPVLTVVALPQVAPDDPPSCGFYTAGRPNPALARVIVSLVTPPQYVALGRPAGVTSQPIGRGSFAIALGSGTLPEARAGSFDGSSGVVLQVFGSTAPDGGLAEAKRLAAVARDRR